jgi:hypothetical protein
LQISITEAGRIISALKTGVIPDTDLELLRIGREKIIVEFERCLKFTAEGSGCIKFISGEYGSGKSFMLNKVRQLAVNSNFVVSRIQITRSLHLNNPDLLYYSIMHNLTTKAVNSGGTDFEELFNIWLDKLKAKTEKNTASNEILRVIASLNNYNSSFARVFLTYVKARIFQNSELSNAASSWIKGERNIPAALKSKIEIKGEIDKNTSMDFLKAFIHLLTLIGYSGLTILIDELELIMSLRADIRKGCYENLRNIIDSCGSSDFKSCLFVFAGTDTVFEDEEKGVKTYHALYQRLGEAISKSTSSISDIRQPVLRLGRLDNKELQELTDRIVEIHKTAYGWEPGISSEAARNWTLLTLSKEKGSTHTINTREFIIKLVEILDILEQNPGYNLYNTELKIVNRNGIDMFVNVLSKPERNI